MKIPLLIFLLCFGERCGQVGPLEQDALCDKPAAYVWETSAGKIVLEGRKDGEPCNAMKDYFYGDAEHL